MVTSTEYALLALRVYRHTNPDIDSPIPSGWRVLPGFSELPDDDTGFSAAAYQNVSTGEIVIAYTGTNGLEDYPFANIPAAASVPLSAQVDRAMQFYSDVASQYGSSNITFTGHSLGGGLASLMSVFFDRPATIFDPAPFALSAINPVSVAIYYNDYTNYQGLANRGVDWSFRSYAFASGLIGALYSSRKSNVTAYSIKGELLHTLLRDTIQLPVIVGNETMISVGDTKLDDLLNAYDLPNYFGWGTLHSMSLLTATLLSSAFKDVLNKVPYTVDLLMDKSLYANDQLSEQVKAEFVRYLIQNQLGLRYVDGTVYQPANGMIDLFAADLQKLEAVGSVQLKNESAGVDLRKALIATIMEYYYFYDAGSGPLQPFIQSVYNGIQFNIDKIAANSDYKGQKLLLDAVRHIVAGSDADKAMTWADRASIWTVQSGAGGLITIGDAQSEVQIGSEWKGNSLRGGAGNDLLITGTSTDLLYGEAGADVLLGGAGEDLLDGGSEDDYLNGGKDNDLLFGGTGFDTYIHNKDDGIDTIVDGDKSGQIIFDGVTLTGANAMNWLDSPKKGSPSKVSQEHGKAFYYTLVDASYTNAGYTGTLWIQEKGATDKIIVNNFTKGELGLDIDFDPKLQLTANPNPANNPLDSSIYAPFTATANLNEGGGLTFAAFSNFTMLPGMQIKFSASDAALANSSLQICKGDDVLSFGADGTLTITLTGDQSNAMYSLIANNSINADTNFALTATLLDAQGNVIGASSSLNVNVDAHNEVSATNASVIYDATYMLQANSGGGFFNTSRTADWYYVQGGIDKYRSESFDMSQVPIGSMPNSGVLLEGGLGDTYIKGGNNRDVFTDGYFNELVGNSFDIIFGGPSGDNDVLVGNGGDDLLVTHGGNDIVYGGDGNDVINDEPIPGVYGALTDRSWLDAPGHSNNDSLYGGAGNDIIVAGGGDAFIDGGTGDDQLYGGEDDDTLLGGEGNDVLWGDGQQVGSFGSMVSGVVFSISDVLNGRTLGNLGYTYEEQLVDSNGAKFGTYLGYVSDVVNKPGKDFMDGGDGNDAMNGGGNSDVMFGGAGDDTMIGDTNDLDTQAGDDYLNGEDGNDKLIGEAGKDTLIGGAGNDQLVGDGLNVDVPKQADDYLDGGDGADQLWGFGGSDTLIGGSGDDYLEGDDSSLTGNTQGQGDDYLDGGDGNDRLVGDGGSDVLYGGIGDDQLDGDSINTVNAAQGDDYLDGGDGNDILVGEGGNDTLLGGTGDDQLDGDSTQTDVSVQGNDYLDGGDGNDKLWGDGGNDTLLGSNGDDQLVGGAGDDTLDGGAGVDSLFGGDGNDELTAGDGDDYLDGGSGDDVLYGNDGYDVIHGGDGNDTIYGGAGTDYLSGDAGNDTYVFNSGDLARINGILDTVVDTQGNNTIVIESGLTVADLQVSGVTGGTIYLLNNAGDAGLAVASGNINFQFGDGTSLTEAQLVGRFASGSTNVVNAADNSFLFTGTGNDLIQSTGNNTTLSGGQGNDTLMGGSSASNTYLFSRGDGNDVVTDQSSQAADGTGPLNTLVLNDVNFSEVKIQDSNGVRKLVIDNGGGSIQVGSAVNDVTGNRTFDKIQFADGTLKTWTEIVASSGIEIVGLSTGGTSALNGTNANDHILGGTDNETINAGSGDDTIDGGAGNDVMNGGVGSDTYVFSTGSGQDTINNTDVAMGKIDKLLLNGLGTSQVQLVKINNDLMVQINGTTDTLMVTNYFNGAGLDQIVFADGTTYTPANIVVSTQSTRPSAFDDWITGTSGNDTISALAGNDTVNAGAGNDTVSGGDGNDVLLGGADNDAISGDYGNDVISGGAGDDALSGGNTGNWGSGSPLTGFDGDDVFVYDRNEGNDQIYQGGGSTRPITGDHDAIQFGANVKIEDLVLSADKYGTLTIQFRNADGSISSAESLTIRGYFVTHDYYSTEPTKLERTIGEFRFQSTGAVYTAQQLEALLLPNNTVGSDYYEGTSGNDVFVTQGGSDMVFGYGGDDQITVTAPSSSSYSYVYGGDGNDTVNGWGELHGDSGNDVLHGGSVMEGGSGSDTYLYNLGDENFKIKGTLDAASSDIDAIQFGAGIQPQDLTVSTSGYDLTIFATKNASSANITIENGLDPINGASIIDEFRFANGQVWSRADIINAATVKTGTSIRDRFLGTAVSDLLIGNGGDDTLNGMDGNDTLIGGTGNDYLAGGNGDDVYRFGVNEGSDEIWDSVGSNVVMLDGGITPNRVSLARSSSRGMLDITNNTATADNLVIVIDGGTNQINIENYFVASGSAPIASIVFSDGTVWDTNAIAAHVADQHGTANTMTGTTGDDTYIVDHRNDVINESASAGTDTVLSSVSYTLPTNVENLTLTGSLSIGGTGNALVNVITGNDATNVLNSAQIKSGGVSTSNADTLIGGKGDDIYYVDTDAMAGGVVPWGNNAAFQNFQDTVIENAGEGYDTIVALYDYSAILPNNVEALVIDQVLQAGNFTYSLADDVRRKFVGNTLDNFIDASRATSGFGTGISTSGFDEQEIVIDGGLGADTMIGNNNKTRFIVDNVNDVVIASTTSFNDTIETSLSYTLGTGMDGLNLTGSTAVTGTGNDLNNILDGSHNTASNLLTGGLGNDTYIVDNSDVIQEAAGEGIDTVNYKGSNSYVIGNNIENCTSTTSSSNAVIGNSLDNIIITGSGNNSLYGAAGNDSLQGGLGNDAYMDFGASSGLDFIYDTGGSSDYIRYTANENTTVEQLQFSRSGNDLVIAENANNAVTIQSWYTSTNNVIEKLYLYENGLSYAYTSAQMQGRADAINTGPIVNAALTNQSLMATQALSYQLAANTFADIESQHSLVYAATLSDGSALPSWLAFDPTTRTFTGTPPSAGAGSYSVLVSATDAGGLSAATGFTLTVTPAVINGTAGDDVLIGDATNNIMNGLAGNDLLDGGLGADAMTGGTGDDTYVVDNAGDAITENANEGMDTVQSSITYTLGSNNTLENLTLTGNTAINGTGNSLDNILVGNAANNTLTGNSGNDTLDGGTGIDTLVGGTGNDIYIVDSTTDIITESASAGTDTVQSSVTFSMTNTANVENLTLTGGGSINGTGNSLSNIIIGNSGDNTLDAGSAGTDSLRGGLGNDTYLINRSTGVTLVENANEGFDTIVSSLTTMTIGSGSNIEALFMAAGTAAINGTGNNLANLLRGNDGANTLAGGGGTDILEGGLGNDILSNSSGNTLLNGGGGTDTLTGTGNNDLLIGGTGNDALTTGQGADIIAFNKGDGQDTVASSTTKDNTLSIGGGTNYADLVFTKSGNNLILKVGASDQITLTNYYASTSNHSINALQIILQGSTDYNAGSSNAMYNKKIEDFNFDGLVAAFDAARTANPSLTSWALTNALSQQYLSGSDTAAIGGDLAYQYGLVGNLSNIGYTPALNILSASNFGTAAQTLQTPAAIAGPGSRLS